MTPKRPKYLREERNGKIIYVPSSDTSSSSRPNLTSQPRSPNVLSMLAGQMLVQVGAICDRWLPTVVLLSAAGVTASLGWLGWQAITNPDMIFWINQFTPGNLNRNIPADDQPKTVDQVTAQLTRKGKQPGEPIVLAADFSFYATLEHASAIAVPLLIERQDSSCPEVCEAIQSIQVYRALELPRFIQLFQTQRRFRKVSQVRVGGPSEADLNRLVRSLTRSGSHEGNSSALAMTDITVKESKDGHRWLLLSGRQSQGSAQATFGQILRINPQRSQLNVMANWLSPSGRMPVWEDVTDDGQPDIVIDQSIELEPSFSVYEVNQAPNGEIWVTPIRLSKAANNQQGYKDALRLAKNGLWLQAQSLMEGAKASSDTWPALAQSQLALIKIHAAELSQDEAYAFSDPVSEIQALLIRGEWTSAKAKILSSRTIYEAVEVVLESDNGQIGDRIHTAAQVGLDQQIAVDWGIIYHYARGGKAQAQSWIKTHHPKSQARLAPLFKALSFPEKKSAAQASSTANTPSSSAPDSLAP